MVLPILNYGSEIWGFHKAPDIERIHIKFLKQISNLRQQIVNAAVYGELGRYPLYVYRKIRILKYLYKIQSKSDYLLFKAFNMKDDYENIVNNWSSEVKSLLDSLGCTNMWNVNISKDQIQYLIQRVKDQYIQQWYSDIYNTSKLDTYCMIKSV